MNFCLMLIHGHARMDVLAALMDALMDVLDNITLYRVSDVVRLGEHHILTLQAYRPTQCPDQHLLNI